MSIFATATHFFLDLGVRATAIFAVTAAVLFALRGASAATRHRIGTFGLAAALVLPLLSLALPRIAVPVLPALASFAGASSRLPWAAILLGLWAAGSLAVGARLVVGWRRVRRLSREAVLVQDREWILDRDAAAASLALAIPVDVKESQEIPVAITSGWRRPFLLIGRAARLWEADRRRVVLLHELAHVKRGDWLALFVAETAVALYWFHPLAQWLGRRVRRDAEQACDELVIGAGTKPSVYAAHLLGIFRSLGAPSHPVAPALAMARPHHFEERLRAILDPRAPLGQPATGPARFAMAGLFAAAAAVTMVQPWKPAQCPAAASASHGTAGTPQCASKPAAVPVVARIESAPEEREQPEAAPSPEPGRSVPALWTPDMESAPDPAVGFVKASNSRRSPRDGSDWYDRGMSLHRRSHYAEAIEAFEKAIGDGYREETASYNIACGYALMGENDKAFEWLHRSMQLGFDLGAYIGHDDDLDGLRSDPRFAELKKAAREQKSSEQKNEARSVASRYERLVARAPKSGEPYFDIGRELLRVDRYDLAAQAFQVSFDRGYRTSTSLYNGACALALDGKKEAALDLLARSLDAGFDQPDLFENDDDLDSLHGDPRFEALARQAQDLSLPGLGDGYGNASGLWSLLSRPNRSKWRTAAHRYQAYAEKHPQSGRAWYNLGYASLAGDRPEQSAPAFQKALDLGYRKPTTMYNLACTNARLDQKDVAFDWLFKAIDAGFDETWTMRHDDDLDNLRGDRRYRKAVEIARTRDRKDDRD
jgi:beta-lactamase regulating signal transducer with metallopeptidase domain/tetratricopeptide (TPR) repeat protein